MPYAIDWKYQPPAINRICYVLDFIPFSFFFVGSGESVES